MAFSANGLLLTQSASVLVYSSVALGSGGSLYAFSGSQIYAFHSPAPAPAARPWALYLGLAAGAFAALLVAAFAARRFCCAPGAAEPGCCARGAAAAAYSGGSEEAFSRQAFADDYEPPLLSLPDAPSASGSSRFPFLFAFKASGQAGSDTQFKASGAAAGNPWGGSSQSGGSSSSSSVANPFSMQ